jgi:hypothetical protein
MGLTLDPLLTDFKKEFKVVAVSDNTNSFGLRQMVVIAKDGTAYKTCASYLNVKKKGEILVQTYNLTVTGNPTNQHFSGCELTERIEDAPDEVIQEIWN